MALELIVASAAAVAVVGTLANLLASFLAKRRAVREQVAVWEQPAGGTTTVSKDLEIRWNVKSHRIDHDEQGGGRTTIRLDPTDAESVHDFLNTIRQEDGVGRRGARGPATPAG